MTADPDRFTAQIDPADREYKTRRGARVLLIDDLDRILLFEDSDPMVPGSRWWLTPGGGIDPGETELQAAVREVEEETGLTITAADLRGPVATQVVVHGFADVIIEQEEVFFVARVRAFQVSTAGHTVEEQITMLRHRWWPRHELEATDDWLWPDGLVELWALAERPDEWPVDLGRPEQSTVPVDTNAERPAR